MGDLEGRRIIVTGAATGIGNATARRLAQAGASLALWDINETAISALAVEIAKSGSPCIGIGVDVTSSASVASAMAQTVKTMGGVDGAFNNAGVGAPTVPAHEIDEADFDRVIGVNLKGVWLCMKAQIQQMIGQGGGVIVNNASVSGLVALAGQAGYTASKHAVVGLTKAAAVEGAPANVRVNAICPAAVRTPILAHLEEAGVTEEVLASMCPQNRIADPSEIAEAVLWLLSPNSSYVTGAALPIDGGWSAQ